MKHGGDLTEAIARHGGAPDDWLDLSTGINPWPWPIPAGLPDGVWQRLPSRADEDALIAAARKAYGMPDGADIAAAAGTQMLIQWLPYLAATGQVAVVGPTYGEHAVAWTKAGREVIAVTDLGEVPESAVHIVVVNPNNPDGRITGLAGLRLGFAIGTPDLIGRIAAALGPWPCSGPALHIGAAALRDQPWADRTRGVLAEQAGKLDKVLVKGGFTIVGGTP